VNPIEFGSQGALLSSQMVSHGLTLSLWVTLFSSQVSGNYLKWNH